MVFWIAGSCFVCNVYVFVFKFKVEKKMVNSCLIFANRLQWIHIKKYVNSNESQHFMWNFSLLTDMVSLISNLNFIVTGIQIFCLRFPFGIRRIHFSSKNSIIAIDLICIFEFEWSFRQTTAAATITTSSMPWNCVNKCTVITSYSQLYKHKWCEFAIQFG